MPQPWPFASPPRLVRPSLAHPCAVLRCTVVQGGGFGELHLKVTYWPFELIDFHKGVLCCAVLCGVVGACGMSAPQEWEQTSYHSVCVCVCVVPAAIMCALACCRHCVCSPAPAAVEASTGAVIITLMSCADLPAADITTSDPYVEFKLNKVSGLCPPCSGRAYVRYGSLGGWERKRFGSGTRQSAERG